MKKILFILIMAGFFLQSCNLISDPKCELISYKFFGPKTEDAAYIKFEVENISESDYAYGIKLQVKASNQNSILQIKEVLLGTIKAGEIVESTAALDSLNSVNDADLFKMELIWYGEQDEKFSKSYEYTPE